MFSLIRPYIFTLDPETAHNLAIKSLKFNFLPQNIFAVENEEILKTTLFGKDINNPIGLAAGFDKNAEVYNEILNLGFGFTEVGTVTPKKQYGNQKPRVFRLKRDNALINRLGFNNDGSDIIKKRIENNIPNGVLGINIGPNKNTADRVNDYLECFRRFHHLANYLTINISSPNTENLRDFHGKEQLKELINAINSEKNSLNSKIPIAVKLSPDLSHKQIEIVSEILLENNIDIAVISNSTDKNREKLTNINKLEKGGLSGKPIEKISNKIINRFYNLIGKKIKIIGVGGADSAESVYEKILNGATLVQLYTGMVYKGPQIADKINKGLVKILEKDGIKNIGDVVGSKKSA